MSIISDIVLDIEDRLACGDTYEQIAAATGMKIEFIAEIDDMARHENDDYPQTYNEEMDGDFDSAMASAGFGTDEDYGYYGEE